MLQLASLRAFLPGADTRVLVLVVACAEGEDAEGGRLAAALADGVGSVSGYESWRSHSVIAQCPRSIRDAGGSVLLGYKLNEGTKAALRVADTYRFLVFLDSDMFVVAPLDLRRVLPPNGPCVIGVQQVRGSTPPSDLRGNPGQCDAGNTASVCAPRVCHDYLHPGLAVFDMTRAPNLSELRWNAGVYGGDTGAATHDWLAAHRNTVSVFWADQWSGGQVIDAWHNDDDAADAATPAGACPHASRALVEYMIDERALLHDEPGYSEPWALFGARVLHMLSGSSWRHGSRVDLFTHLRLFNVVELMRRLGVDLSAWRALIDATLNTSAAAEQFSKCGLIFVP